MLREMRWRNIIMNKQGLIITFNQQRWKTLTIQLSTQLWGPECVATKALRNCAKIIIKLSFVLSLRQHFTKRTPRHEVRHPEGRCSRQQRSLGEGVGENLAEARQVASVTRPRWGEIRTAGEYVMRLISGHQKFTTLCHIIPKRRVSFDFKASVITRIV